MFIGFLKVGGHSFGHSFDMSKGKPQWPEAESNCRPLVFQTSALPTELSGLKAGTTGFEPATSCVTGRRKLQTLPRPQSFSIHYIYLIQQIDINAWVGWESNPRP